MARLLFLVLFMVLLSAPFQVKAQNYTNLDMVAGQSHAVPGESFDIALVQNIERGWHTYWTNPGDAGEPIAMQWTKPDGINISNLKFPTPTKIEYEGLIDYGYKDRAIYTATVNVSDDFSGDALNIRGQARMLVCNDICIPESAEIALTIPVKRQSAMPTNQSIFGEAQAAMPTPVSWDTAIEEIDDEIMLSFTPPADLFNQFTDVTVFPVDWGVVDNASLPISDIGEETITITQKAGTRSLLELPQTSFVIQTNNDAYLLTTNPTVGLDLGVDMGLVLILAFAFLGGLILNLMPCVFPILSMKALSLAQLSGFERRHSQINGLAYTAGVVLSFIAVAALLIVLKDAGARIGWGFQLQNPFIVIILFVLFLAITANLLGWFDLGGRFIGLGAKHVQGHDTRASFLTGVLAMIVATPCTAPFMATAIGFALTQSAITSLLIFAVLGFGLAFPYLLLCFVPAVQKILPKPGPWMNTFKKILAIPMFLSALWLLWVFAQQTQIIERDAETAAFSRDGLQTILTDNPDKPVFVNMTAAWCITCLVNEKTTLKSDTVKDAFEQANVIYVKGDWTNRDTDIAAYLNEFDRDGVPLYVYYNPADGKGLRGKPTILPQILTPSIVTNTINKDN